MNNDVIITVLEGIATNDNLPYYNAIMVSLNTDTPLVVENAKVKGLDGKTFDVYNQEGTTLIANNVSEYTIGSTARSIVANSNNTKIIVTGKYNDLTRIDFKNNGSVVANRVPFDIGELAYSGNLLYTTIPNKAVEVEGVLDLSTLPKIDTFRIEVLNPSKVELIIPEGTNLPDLRIFSYFRRYSAADAGLKININRLSNSKKLVVLSLPNNTGVEGNVNEFLDALYNNGNGKISGNLTIDLSNTSCEYNGNPITTSLNFSFSTSGWSQV